MADFLTPKERSYRMSLIRSRDTGPERQLAKVLRGLKLKFRRHSKLPGTPDFVLLESKVAVFADGDFWHGRSFSAKREKLSPFWLDKITNNMARDRRVDRQLRRLGYSVIRVWEGDLKKREHWCSSRIVKAHLTRTKKTISWRQSNPERSG